MKRIILFALVFALCCTLAIPSVAATSGAEKAADHLYSLGLFRGTGTDAAGKPIYELDRQPTRAEAVTMLVRLLGKESDALGGTWATPFIDIPGWAKPYVGYAYVNRLTMGISSTEFGSSNKTTASMYITFVLRALGYSSSTDFSWDRAWELSDRLNITDGSFRDNTSFTRGSAAIVSDKALSTRFKGKTTTLLQQLENDGAVFSGLYLREKDETVYARALGEYSRLIAEAEAVQDTNERYIRFAKAEAALLDSAVMIPDTTQGGAYQISRIAPRTVPYVQWGNDDDRLFGLVISADDFLTPEERDVFWDAWNAAVAGKGEYDPKAIMEELGHKVATDYTCTYTTAPVTLDWLNTSQADIKITVQTVTGLVQYDNLNRMQPALAESWEISRDGRTYIFHIRPGVYWYTSAGVKYAEVTAQDFVSGFQHMLDAQAGLEWLVEGIVAGAGEYLFEGGSFSDVGYKATDKYTLVVTLERPTSYFLTMLTYNCFLPICDSFYRAQGGVFGIEELAAAKSESNTYAYTFGDTGDVNSQVYCGPFLLKKFQDKGEIQVVRNRNYFNDNQTTLDSIKWVYDAGRSSNAIYNDTVSGVYAAVYLTDATGLLELAKEDGNFDKYAYVTETTSTTYFGGLNLNRGTFVLKNGVAASSQTELQKYSTHTAMQNKSFRQALQFAFDKGSINATSRGEYLKYSNLRNIYTHPEFVSLTASTKVDGVLWPAGTFYGEIVQYYLDQLGSPIRVEDGIDGWYHPAEARAALEKAKAELGNTVSWPVVIDVVYYSISDAPTAKARTYQASIERTLGRENVRVNLIETTTADDYYACGYRASSGAAGNFDMFYGSGWGPDYGDPSTYLNSFLGDGAGYMTKTIGLF